MENQPLEKIVGTFKVGDEVTGSQAMVYTLEKLGVEKVAAYIGGRAIELIDKLGQSRKIELIEGPAESDLGHAMQAYFKVTRKPGVVVVTSGPGGTNLATPIKDAQSDGDALIAIIGQVPNEAIDVGEEAFQGAPIVEPYALWSKAGFRIDNVDQIQSVLKTAYEVSTKGRPGPVVIELPSPIAKDHKTKLQHLDYVPLIPIAPRNPAIYTKIQVKSVGLDDLVGAMKYSNRPTAVLGGGIYNGKAVEESVQVMGKSQIPFFATLMLLGAVKRSPFYFGMPGMHGPAENNLALHNSDLVLYAGGRLDDRIIGDPKRFAPDAKLFWLEPNYPGIGTAIAQRVQKIEMEAKPAMEYLLRNLPVKNNEKWINQIHEWREKYPAADHVSADVIKMVREFSKKHEKKEPFVATGVGAHQMDLAQNWDFNPQDGYKMLLTSGGLGTMGTGLPFAVGSQIADPTRPVYLFNGDGSSVMDMRSMLFAWDLFKQRKSYGIKQIVFRDESLNMVEFWQDRHWDGRKTATQLRLPKNYFWNLAIAHEFSPFTVDYKKDSTGKKEVDLEWNRKIIEEFVRYKGNALLEVRLAPHNVLPMIPAAQSVAEIVLPKGQKLDPNDLTIGRNWYK